MPPNLSSVLSDCKCCTPPFSAENYNIQLAGIDRTFSRHGEVYIKQCKFCGINWVEYFYENEAFSESGRWFKGQITDALSKPVKPEEVVAFLEQLDGYFYGGSFFRHSGAWGKGKLHL